MTPDKRPMINHTVIIVIIALIGILFVPVVSAGITIKGNSEQFPGSESASSSYQYITIDTGFPLLSPVNFSQTGYTPLQPHLYSAYTPQGSTHTSHITMDAGGPTITPVKYNESQMLSKYWTQPSNYADTTKAGPLGNPFIKPYANASIYYPETATASGLTNSFGLQPTANSGLKNNVSLIQVPDLTPNQQKLGSSLRNIVYPETNPAQANGIIIDFIPGEFYKRVGSTGPSEETISAATGDVVRVIIVIAPNSDLASIYPYIYKSNDISKENGWITLDAWVELKNIITLSNFSGVRSIDIPTLVELE